MQSQWLQTTISGVDDKMKEIVNLLEHKDISHEKRKKEITKIVKDLCLSYCCLAHDYEYLKSTSTTENTLKSAKQKYVSQSWDENSHPESTIEDAESESESESEDVESELLDNLKTAVIEDAESESEGESTMFEYANLVEENTSIQMELITRNSEKREMIVELRDQVRILVSEKETLQRQLSYYERNIVGATSPSRKTMFRDKFFKCST